jgi:dihydrofolate synthase/folylpolyglutamate synthase
VDWGVYEVGLGGRLDATNVLRPRVCAITTLGLDHTQVLGETLPEIAREKAGILKPGIPCVAAQGAPEAIAEIVAAAGRVGAPLELSGREVRHAVRRPADGGFGIEADVEAHGRMIRALRIPLAGFHQGENAAVAVGLLEALRRAEGVPLGEEAIRRGLAAVRVPGRLHRVMDSPAVVIDVAHNEVAMKATVSAVAEFFPHRELHAALGLSADKDARKVLAPLCGRASRLILTTSGTPRSAAPADLAAVARSVGFARPEVELDFGAALDSLLAGCGKEDLALVTGSFYVAGKAFRHWGISPDSCHVEEVTARQGRRAKGQGSSKC